MDSVLIALKPVGSSGADNCVSVKDLEKAHEVDFS